jgi:hypothetical protein
MCFSATASFAAGGALSAMGGLTVARAQTKAELPFASIPLWFGIQQAIEGVVWLSFGSDLLNTIATYAFVLFSHIFWPIFLPLALLLIESDPLRQKILQLGLAIGSAVGFSFLYLIIVDPVTSQIVHGSIAYHSSNFSPLLVMMLYLIATCGSCLASSERIINLFGIALFLSFALSTWFFTATFFSVWCFFAAILSVLVYWHLARKHKKNPSIA